MKVFISWSGERSHSVAALLDNWIQCVIQSIEPFLSSKDIDRGSLWFTEIHSQLLNTNFGIVCLTQENKDKPWILFESGALAKSIDSVRVCTFLIDLLPSDLENPLAQFNHTTPDKKSMWQFIDTINRSLGERALKEPILEKVFEMNWPQFEADFDAILKITPKSHKTIKRSENELMQEVLNTVRNMERKIMTLESVKENFSNETKFHYSDSLIMEEAIRNKISSYLSVREVTVILREAKHMIRKGLSVEKIIEHLVHLYSCPKHIAEILVAAADNNLKVN